MPITEPNTEVSLNSMRATLTVAQLPSVQPQLTNRPPTAKASMLSSARLPERLSTTMSTP